jgi:hypothetical protein
MFRMVYPTEHMTPVPICGHQNRSAREVEGKSPPLLGIDPLQSSPQLVTSLTGLNQLTLSQTIDCTTPISRGRDSGFRGSKVP